MAAVVVVAVLSFVSTLAGGYTALRWPGRRELLMTLAGGVVLGAALFELLPEAVEQAAELDMSIRVPLGAVVVGYMFLHAFERFVHRHGEVEGPSPAGVAGATAFVVHSFFDGLAIGLGFRIDPALGVAVAAAVIGHDFSDGLSTVSYLTIHGHPASRSWQFLVADALAPVCGALVAFLTPVPEGVFPVALGLFSGLFLYAATATLLPSGLAMPARQAVPLALVGAGAMLLVSLAV